MLGHGSGGKLSAELIEKVFVSRFRNSTLEKMDDQAVLEIGGTRLAFTTDSFVVTPIFFPGGDIGSLAVNGTVNDLAMGGAKPLYLVGGVHPGRRTGRRRSWSASSIRWPQRRRVRACSW